MAHKLKKAATVQQVIVAKVPDYYVKVTSDVIAKATPDDGKGCMIGLPLWRQGGISSLRVTPYCITFNALVEIGGKMVMMRHLYPMPKTAGARAHKFDDDYYASGRNVEYARSQQKPFSFRLQGRDAVLKPLVVQPRGPDRKKRVERVRRSSLNDKVVTAPGCPPRARYWPKSIQKAA